MHFNCPLLLHCGLKQSFSSAFRYLFGEELDGMAYVVFGVMEKDQKKSFPGSLQRVPVSPSFLLHLSNYRAFILVKYPPTVQ